jgi:hypothetical protein
MQNNPRSFQKFKKIPLIFSILFLVFSCTVFFFLHKKINDNKETADLAQIEWQSETSRREEMKSLDTSFKAIESERILLETHFAESNNIVPFLDTIEKLALSVKAESEVTSVDILKDKGGLQVVIKTSGTFEAVYKFLTLLENSQYELEFVSVDVERTAEQTGSGATYVAPEWQGTFKVKLLSFIEENKI